MKHRDSLGLESFGLDKWKELPIRYRLAELGLVVGLLAEAPISRIANRAISLDLVLDSALVGYDVGIIYGLGRGLYQFAKENKRKGK